MKKLILLCFVFVSLSYGFSYNNTLLKAQASIFPKILLLDKKLEEKLIDGKIIYTIIYNKDDYSTVQEIQKFIKENFNEHFDKYSYKINAVEFLDFSAETDATVVYVLNSDKYIEEVAKVVKIKGIISFAYDLKNLKSGLLFSLMLEKSTILYINKNNLYSEKVDFLDSLLQMVRFID